MNIVIIGNGISGVTAARWTRKLGNDHITIISAESKYFFSRTALMYVYMGHLRLKDTKPYEDGFWEKNRINLIQDYVSSIDFKAKILHLEHDSKPISYDKLILALGSSPNKFGWPGQDLIGVQGLYSLQNLEYIEAQTKNIQNAVIVGGGLIGIELAEMLHSRGIHITFLVREKSYWDMVLPPEESSMINKEINQNGIDLRLETELAEIISDEHGRCKAIRTSSNEIIDAQFVGLTAGVHPNVNFLRNTELKIEKGIVVNTFLQTNIEDVFAIGDCAQLEKPTEGRRAIEAIWYTGRKMGEIVAHNIYGNSIPYNPGIWFNSAKFFDIEYQVYGTVLAKPPEHHLQFYWENKQKNQSFRLVYDAESKNVLGINVMGIRLRHEVCDKWIKDKNTAQEVMSMLHLASFNPEFFNPVHQEISSAFKTQFGIKSTGIKKESYNQTYHFLQSK